MGNEANCSAAYMYHKNEAIVNDHGLLVLVGSSGPASFSKTCADFRPTLLQRRPARGSWRCAVGQTGSFSLFASAASTGPATKTAWSMLQKLRGAVVNLGTAGRKRHSERADS
jgi:hypothetical protein